MSYHCELLSPKTLTYERALEIGEVYAHGYSHSPLALYTSSKSSSYWCYETYSDIYQDKSLNSSQRLDRSVRRAKAMEDIAHLMACLTMEEVMTPGTANFVVVDDDTGRIVGSTSWDYPNYLKDQLDEQMGRVGWKFKVSSWLVKKKYSLYDLWIRKGSTHPFHNSNLTRFAIASNKQFYSDIVPEEELCGLSNDELQNVNYPTQLMAYCHFFCILPQHQRKGLGKRLMRFVLDTIPTEPTPVSVGGKTTNVPMKLHLEASEEGKGMYQQCGFKVYNEFVFKDGDQEVPVAHLVLTR